MTSKRPTLRPTLRLAACLAAALTLAPLPQPALAQDDDRSLIVGFLEDQLSDASRQIRLEGFQGALSARATLDELTIADEDGVWLTLRGATLDWNRAALFRGRVEINTLTAEEILLPRLPPPGATDSAPEAAAEPFRLPDLPVSIRIGALEVERIVIGAPVIGQDVTGRLAGALALDDDLSVDLSLERTDGALGEITLNAAYTEAPAAALTLQLGFREGPGGIAATALDIPGAPALDLGIAGDGPLSDFRAEIDLASDGQPRLSGDVTIGLADPGTGTGDLGFAADLGGDITALLLPDARAFFGPDVALKVSGAVPQEGGLRLDTLDLAAATLRLTGALRLDSDNRPEAFDLTGRIADPQGGRVTLPGSDLSLRTLDITARHDRALGDGFTAEIAAEAPQMPDGGAARLALTASGVFSAPDALSSVTADLDLTAAGLALTDPALAEAVGDAITGQARILWTDGAPLEIDGLRLGGADYSVALDGRAAIADRGLTVAGEVALDLGDLSRFSALAGQELTGSIRGTIDGGGDPLGGLFDAELAITGEGLSTGIAQADALIASGVQIAGRAARDQRGLRVDDLRIAGDGLALALDGRIAPQDADIQLDLALARAERVVPQLPGTLTLAGTAGRVADGPWRLDLDLDAPQGITARIDATANPDGTIAAEFDAAIAEVSRLAAGFPGPARLSGTVRQEGSAYLLDTAATGPFGLSADISARLADAISAQISAQLPDVAPLAPGISGALALEGTVQQDGDSYGLNFDVAGPGAASTALRGAVTADGEARAVTLQGTVPLALANRLLEPRAVFGTARYDLAIDGPLALSNVTGRITTSGSRVTLPTVNKALNDLEARVDLSGGAAQLDVGAAFSDGGRLALAGRMALGSSLPGDLTLRLLDLQLRDGAFYETSLAGAITLRGPLAGGARIAGQIGLGPTEVRLAETGLSFGGAIPDGLRHVNEPGRVLASRTRAGLVVRDRAGGGSAGAAYPLDVTIDAPGRIFLRGRGLDAEVGGQLILRGTSAALRPEGAFELLRGRLDLLGKRLTLDEGAVTMAGDLVPALRLRASIPGPDMTAFVTIEGTVEEPEIVFSSEPELPEDEVLAQAFFGQSLSSLSALQAARLAAGVATLAGRGGGTMDRLRGALGGADLDVTQNANGATALSFGTYIGENAYTDVTTSSDGDAEINLKIDLTDSITVKGSADNSGDTSLGVFFERDY